MRVYFTRITMAALCIFSALTVAVSAKAENSVVLRVVVPESTPQDAVLSLGAEFNGWNPKHPDFILEKDAGGTYEIQLKGFETGKILHFKVTRGDWDKAEINADGSNLENRTYTVREGEQLVNIEVAAWRDLSGLKPPSTVVGTVIEEDWVLPTFGGTRKIRIYLPPDYKESGKRYPVIYMSDGQNLFDNALATAGEWQMDELMERLAARNSPITSIVVGVDHAGADRTQEYMPFPFSSEWRDDRENSQGVEWANWLVDTLKPHIDSRYRTKPARAHTTIMGSSMGGLIACYTALAHQEVFSKAGCYSSAFLKRLVGDGMLDFVRAAGRQYPMRIYFDMGDEEFGLFGPNILKEHEALYNALVAAGFSKSELNYQVIKGGTHDEPSWRSRTENILEWLYQPPVQ